MDELVHPSIFWVNLPNKIVSVVMFEISFEMSMICCVIQSMIFKALKE